MSRSLALRFPLALPLLALACSSSPIEPDPSMMQQPPPPVEKKLTRILLDPAANVSIAQGESQQIDAIGNYDDDSTASLTKEVTWTSSDETIATVAGGLVTALQKGSVTISAKLGAFTRDVQVGVTVDEVIIETDVADPLVLAGRGAEHQLWLTFVSAHGAAEDATFRAAWASSDPGVAFVSDEEGSRGLLIAGNPGHATITAWLDGLTATLDVTVECRYPQGTTQISRGYIMPNISWPAAHYEDGSVAELSLETMYCSAEWENVDTLFFIVSAGWCPGCPEYVRYVKERNAQIEAAGGKVVFIEMETGSGAPANSEDANHWLDTITGPGFAIRVGDVDSQPTSRIFAMSPSLEFLPFCYAVRKRDMRIITDQGGTQYYLDFVGIAENPDSF